MRIIEYMYAVIAPEAGDNRWELYRVLSDPSRLRLIAIASEEELSIGELAEVLGESQPTVSKQVSALRRLRLLEERRQGTRVLVRLRPGTGADPVIADALGSGRALCAADRAFERVAEVVRRRDAAAREFFARAGERGGDDAPFPAELPAYLRLVSLAGEVRALAVDVGTGDGRLLEVLAPTFRRVVAVDREPARLARAASRLKRRGHENVQLLRGDLDDDRFGEEVAQRGGADAVFASRVLHHAPRPAEAVRRMAGLVRPGGSLVLLDYGAHEDERMRTAEADLWLGFAPEELCAFAREAGLTGARVEAIPRAWCGTGPDAHLAWQACVARRAPGDRATQETAPAETS